jgi:hypothetical protein
MPARGVAYVQPYVAGEARIHRLNATRLRQPAMPLTATADLRRCAKPLEKVRSCTQPKRPTHVGRCGAFSLKFLAMAPIATAGRLLFHEWRSEGVSPFPLSIRRLADGSRASANRTRPRDASLARRSDLPPPRTVWPVLPQRLEGFGTRSRQGLSALPRRDEGRQICLLSGHRPGGRCLR